MSLPDGSVIHSDPEILSGCEVRPMKPIPITSETEAVARRVIWFEEPVRALSDPIRFMAYAMTYATHEDMKIIRRYVSDGWQGRCRYLTYLF